MMITLYFNEGNIFLYEVKDWITLRKTHRIIGEIVGNASHIPSLPLKISPEEALLLLNENVVEIKEILQSSIDKIDTEQFESEMLKYQIMNYKEARRIQVESVLDLILEKRKMIDNTKTREEVLQEELEKTPLINKSNMIWPIFLKSYIHDSTLNFIYSDAIINYSTALKFKTFQDLHKKGYYITAAGKFGGDFLVYLGDPLCHHAIFIVKCIENAQQISPMEIVAFGRLGTSVKKHAVLASLIDQQICYLTINWIDAYIYSTFLTLYLGQK